MSNVHTPPYLNLLRPQPTGNVLVTMKRGSDDSQRRSLEAGFRRSRGNRANGIVRSVSNLELAELDTSKIEEPVLLREFGIGLVPARDMSEAASVSSAMSADSDVEEARPEFYMFVDAAPFPVQDDADRTWGIAATGASGSVQTGKGIRIAVLDTGFDLDHPDFFGRSITHRSFVAGETVNDIRGHGTHCIGTAAGPGHKGNHPRYGVASNADIFVGKVLNDAGTGREIDILAGMAWAISEKCDVISMSLGRAVQPNEKPSVAYERMGKRALDNECLIVAAAGNNSTRSFSFIAPVAAPANSPSIMAIAAVDAEGEIAWFSCGGINPDGGEVDIAGPGVAVFSSFPGPRFYNTLDGTSMACPHIAGLAALWAEKDHCLRGKALWDALVNNGVELGLDKRDVGCGLGQAPKTAGV